MSCKFARRLMEFARHALQKMCTATEKKEREEGRGERGEGEREREPDRK